MLIPRPTFQYLRTYMYVQLCMTPEKYRRYIWGIRSSSMVIIVESRSLDRFLYYFYLMNYSWWSWVVMWCIFRLIPQVGEGWSADCWHDILIFLLFHNFCFICYKKSLRQRHLQASCIHLSFSPSIAHAGMHISWDLRLKSFVSFPPLAV